jgi:hypothetical protein
LGWHVGVQAAGLATAIVLGGIWAAHKRAEPMDHHQLRIQAGELRSQAAEAGALLELRATRQVTDRFAAVHLKQLRGHTSETETRLRGSSYLSSCLPYARRLESIAHELAATLASNPQPGVLETLRARANDVDTELPRDPP